MSDGIPSPLVVWRKREMHRKISGWWQRIRCAYGYRGSYGRHCRRLCPSDIHGRIQTLQHVRIQCGMSNAHTSSCYCAAPITCSLRSSTAALVAMADTTASPELRLFSGKHKHKTSSTGEPQLKKSKRLRQPEPEDRRNLSGPDDATPSGEPSSFADLGLSPHLMTTCASLGMKYPTPVQVCSTESLWGGLASHKRTCCTVALHHDIHYICR